MLGLDEVGRGCLAGPVVAAAVVLRPEAETPGLDDSKKLTPLARRAQWRVIHEAALAVAWSFVGPRGIEATDIRRASLLAMRVSARRARTLLHPHTTAGTVLRLHVLVDGVDLVPGLELSQQAVVGADGKSRAVAAASVVAKVVRDGFMERLDAEFPAYGFAHHKGYATAEHRAALDRHGPCPWHRRTFRPVLELRLPFEIPVTT